MLCNICVIFDFTKAYYGAMNCLIIRTCYNFKNREGVSLILSHRHIKNTHALCSSIILEFVLNLKYDS